jgi:hypothetical protein
MGKSTTTTGSSNVTNWKCVQYGPNNGISGSSYSTIPDALRCWGN